MSEADGKQELIEIKDLPTGRIRFCSDCLVNLGDGRKMPVHSGEDWEVTAKIFRRIR